MRPSSSHSFVAAFVMARSRKRRLGAGVERRSGRGLGAVRLDELLQAIRLLGAQTDPVVDAADIQLELRFTLAGDRVEVTHLFKVRAALTLAAVRDDDVIEGLIRSAAPGEANGDHLCLLS